MRTGLLDDLATRCDGLVADGLFKRERVISSPQSAHVTLADGSALLNLCANNYLGLADHPDLVAAAKVALDDHGYGMASVRFICGTQDVHKQLEGRLSAFLGTDDTILYSSCFDANGGLFETILDEQDAVISDSLNHASIIDGTRQARVPVSVYAHNDVEAARAAIVEHGAAGRRSVIVTDSVFSMDGDVAPLFELAELAHATGALLVVDDAHAVFAGHGADALTSSDAEILIVGTLSKALGSLGGFVAGPRSLVDWCRNTARSFIFSTASPPSVVAAALAALAVVRSEEGSALTAALRANVDALLPGHVSAVVPVVLGEERRALDVSAALLERGLLVPAIRPPTVAVGASRLRIAVSAAHTPTEVAELIAALGALGVTLDAEVAA